VRPTLADGLAVGRVGDLPFEIARNRIDEIITVNEEHLALAGFRLIELKKSVVEGAGAVPLAAFLSGKLTGLENRFVVLCLSGGNIDLMHLDRVIQFGMVADGRLCRFTAVISDRPGGLAHLARLIASTGANIKDISHDRAFSGPDVAMVRVLCVVETTDHQHIDLLFKTIRSAGIEIMHDQMSRQDQGAGQERYDVRS
jgi:threonine dehydratase